MPEAQLETHIYQGFWISVILKGLISLLEMLAGFLVLAIPDTVVVGATQYIVTSGLLGSASGFLATLLIHAVQSLENAELFVAFYLFSRGLIKVLLVIALLRNKLWAYPASLVVLALFVVYQVYQIITIHSLIVSAITIFDLVVMYFIWREYQIVKKHHGIRKERFVSTGTE